jgi:hypothetical protein
MILALVLAVVVVALEFHAQSQNRAGFLRRQLTRAQSKVRQLQQEVASANHQATLAHQELAVQQTLNRILLRPETKLIHFDNSNSALSGFVALNQQLAITAIVISGTQTARQTAQVYWLPRNGALVPATQFSFDDHGRAIILVELPPFFRSIDALIIATQPAGRANGILDKPLLRAAIAPAIR